jgi:hypothetical protein
LVEQDQLDELNKPIKRDRPDRPNEQDRLGVNECSRDCVVEWVFQWVEM